MKKLLQVLIALLIIFTLVGCANENKEEPLVDPIKHVGVVQLLQHDALDAATKGFVDQLSLEFSNIDIDVKNASGESANCSIIANGFVVDEKDLILAVATPALQAAVAATEDIPILGTAITEYGVALGIENFNGTPGGNVSGTSDLAPLEDQAQMIIDLIPGVKKVGIIYCSSEPNSTYQVKVVKEFLNANGIEVIEESFVDSNEVSQKTEDLCLECDALYIPTDNQAVACAETINNIALVKKVPIICGEEGACAKCGIATLTIDYYELGKVTGEMAAKILKGEANIEDMAIEYFPAPVKKYNKEIAETLGIEIPEDYIAIE